MTSPFFALMARMRHIARWGLMRNSQPENLQEHALMTAVLAHGLAIIRRDALGLPADPERAATAALFHDAPEILTGDLPTPVKYFSPEIRAAYRQVEDVSAQRLCDLLPEALQPADRPLLTGAYDNETLAIVHAADKLAAYVKCIEELAAGNQEFARAAENTRAKLQALHRPEVDYFLEHFSEAFGGSLDELGL